MGKKKETYSKRKRKALLIDKCKNMANKRKRSVEQCSETKAVEPSLDLSESQTMPQDFLEGEQNNTTPIYEELQNVLPLLRQKGDTYSKRKRKALLTDKCNNMAKKRKLSLQLSSEYKTVESSLDLSENQTMSDDFLEGNQDNTTPIYEELQNVLPKSSYMDNIIDVPCNIGRIFKDTTEKNTEINSTISPDITECTSETETQFHELECTSEISTETQLPDLGHRIIDVNHFMTELTKISQHKSLFECGLATMKLVSEHTVGLQSEFTYVCSMCGYRNKIKSSRSDVNKDAVAGVMAAGCGHAQLTQFSAAVGLPIMSSFTYNKTQDEICEDWEETAWDEMKKAGDREREAAIKEGKVTKDGTPVIDVIVDGCWSKRSYRTNYSALSGAAAIIGRRFRQVLYMCVKNKYCCICARAEKKKETPKKHECYKNFNGPSTAMESTIITEGFKQSIDMHGLIYSRFIADGDSSTYSKIIDARPYPGITVEKIYCRNHLLRNFCNKLQQLGSDTHYNSTDRKNLTQDKILRSRKYICNAIALHKDTKNEDGLYRDINASIGHAFNLHEKCNRELCKYLGPDAPNPFFGSLLWQKLKTLVAQLADKSHSLIEDVDSNVVERFNGVIAKLVGGKRINYSQRRSYQARCAGAVISFNTGKLLSTVHQNIYGNTAPYGPIQSILKHEKATNHKRLAGNQNTRKKNRTLVTKNANLDYGEVVDKPDLDEATFSKAKTTFVENLTKTDEERRDIEKRTILQSESGEWLELRRNMLTASNFGKIVKRKPTNSCKNLVKNLLYKPNIDHVQAICHGKKHEKIALEQLSAMKKIKIQNCGLFIDDKQPFLGATPDGITTDDMLIEIKCPVVPFKIGIEEAINKNKMHFYKKDKNGEIVVNQKSDWYFQIQGQLHICKKSQCLLGIWYGDNKIKTEIIQKDDKFWAEVMEPKLLKFYYDCLLPELVDPRHIRNKPIRDPEYVIVKSKENKAPNNVTESNEVQNNPICSNNIIGNLDKVDNIAEGKEDSGILTGVCETGNVDDSNHVMSFSEY